MILITSSCVFVFAVFPVTSRTKPFVKPSRSIARWKRLRVKFAEFHVSKVWNRIPGACVLRCMAVVTIEQLPHQLELLGCSILILVPGRPPLCLRYRHTGHVRKNCQVSRCGICQRYGVYTFLFRYLFPFGLLLQFDRILQDCFYFYVYILFYR